MAKWSEFQNLNKGQKCSMVLNKNKRAMRRQLRLALALVMSVECVLSASFYVVDL